MAASDPAGANPGEAPQAAVEIRVHGIGDHNPWSALGSPTLVVDGYPRGPDVAVPPSVPSHEVRLVNWSRKSRKVAGLLWYVALPFTLVNSAGFMRDSSGEPTSGGQAAALNSKGPRGHTLPSAAVGLLLTLLTYVWSLALIDTVARRAFVGFTSTSAAGPTFAVLLGASITVGILARAARPDVQIPRWLLGSHVAVAIAAGAVSAIFRPSHWKVSHQVPGLLTTWGPSPTFRKVPQGQPVPSFQDRVASGQLVPYLDAIVATSLFVIVVTVVIAGIGVLTGFRRQAKKQLSTQHFGSALALPTAVILFVSVASALRLFVDNGLFYLARHDLVPGGGPNITAPFGAREILPPLNTTYAGRDDWIIDLLPIIGIFGLAAMMLCFVAVNLFSFGAGRPRLGRLGDDAAAQALWKRALVLCLPKTLGPTLVAAAILWAGALWLVSQWVLAGSDRVWSFFVVFVQVLSGIVVLLVLTGKGMSTVRKVVGLMADIVGFWAVTSHPFAGASYREPVLQGVLDQLKNRTGVPTVLVSHSQGSVLCAWLLHRHRIDLASVNLITCGSPLKSLYGEFFPAHFPSAFFEGLASRDGRWINFWRRTDPIATPMPGLAEEDNREIPDPIAGRLKVHGDYWIAPQQIAAVDELLQ